ncbi:MAG: FtsX-like permease family protein, partial [Ekhidna sp.]
MASQNSHPPKLILRFFRWFCHPDLLKYVEGDLLELYEYNIEKKGVKKANQLLTWEILKLLRPSLVKNVGGTHKLNYYGMLKHNIKISYRNLVRRKSYAAINIGGLVMGLSITLLISLWIVDELSFDKQNDNYERVARVMQKQTLNGETMTGSAAPFPLPIALEKEYGDDFEYVVPGSWFGDYVLSKEETVITTRGGFMDIGAPHVMSLNMLKGNRNSLSDEKAILLSASTSQALFGDADPIDQLVKIHDDLSLRVTGIFEDIPKKNSFHRVTFIGQWDFYLSQQDWINKTAWNDNSFQLFVMTKENVNMEVASKKIMRVKYNNMPESERLYDTKVFLHPMKDWHLRSNWENGVKAGGDIQYVWWFGIIGAFVLLLACVNFMNLSTAQSIKRAKEVGVRKAIGTGRRQLIAQFLTESTLIVFISFLLASLVVLLMMPFFNDLTNKDIAMPLVSGYYWLFGLGFALFIGLLSGSYPAIYLSSFNAIQVLKG